MSFITVKLVVPHNTGLPEDAITNSFAIKPTTGDRNTAATAFTTELKTFYDSLGGYKSSQMNWAGATAEYVDLLDPRPRTPYRTDPVALLVGAGTYYDVPAEVAMCISYMAPAVSGENPRRRRGRVYIGPLAFLTAADSPVIPATIINGVLPAWLDLTTNPAYNFCVYSRYNHHAVPVGRNINEKLPNGDPVFPEVPDALPNSFQVATRFWMDNAWDTQRRRGPKATSRTFI